MKSKAEKSDHSSVNRRDFLKAGAVGAALVAAVGTGVSFCTKEREQAGSKGRPVKPDTFQWKEATAEQLQMAMTSGELTAVSLLVAYLDRIQRLDKQGPLVNSVLELNPDAMEIARKLDTERAAGNVRGPLHGIPVLIKGNIDTHDRMSTTAGSLALAGSIPLIDASIVSRMREAGVVIMGKANLSEWANFRSTRSSSGWSSQGGQTRNPYALDRSPCGSSSGSGAAVSANFCAISVGTETDGSIVCPSNANGVVGIKPTVGLVSRSGIIPISHSQDTAGPMARSVADAAALLSVMAGSDPKDPATSAIPGTIPDCTRFLDKDGLKGVRIGVARKYFGFHEYVDSIMETAIATMKDAGAVIVDPADIETKGKIGKPEWEVLLYEFKHNLNAYLATLGDEAPARKLADLIAFKTAHPKQTMPFFRQEIFELAEAKGPLTEKAYLDALSACRKLSREKGIDATLKKHRLDAIVAPTGGPAWKIDRITGDHFLGGSSESAAVAGYPCITVPAGFVFGLPVGISFFSTKWQESTLIRLAYAFEQATGARRVPEFRAEASLD
ncbi:MAG: amidase [Holophagae bacterium]|nr:amidase [Holophagae bacterium]